MNQDTLLKATRHYGHAQQRAKTVEECAELIVAIQHDDADHMAEETADVLIMAHQMRLMLGPGLVDNWVQIKLDRLEERMNG